MATSNAVPAPVPPTGSSLLIVPSATAFELKIKKKSNGTPKKGSGPPSETDTLYDPRNFLVRGGTRNIENRLQEMNKMAVKDLRLANEALVGELLRLRAVAQEDRDSATQLDRDYRAEQQKLTSLQSRLDEETRLRHDFETAQQHRMKEIQRRFREEHTTRCNAEADAARQRAARESLEGQLARQLAATEAERRRLDDALSESRTNAARLEALVSADAATIADLRGRLGTAEARLEQDMAAHAELAALHRAADANSAALTERTGMLSSALAEAEGKLRAATARVALLEDEVAAVNRSLAAERSSAASTRESSARLQRDLTELQAASAVAASHSAADRSEVDRLRGQVSELRDRCESLESERGRMGQVNFEQGVHSRTHAARAEAMEAERDAARTELAETRSALTHQLEVTRADLSRQLNDARREHYDQLESVRDEASRQLEAVRRQCDQQLDASLSEAARKLESARAELGQLVEARTAELRDVQIQLGRALESQALLRSTGERDARRAEQYDSICKEKAELEARLQDIESSLRNAEAELARYTSSSSTSQLDLWRAEAAEVAEAASRWKQRATALQDQLTDRNQELARLEDEVRAMGSAASRSAAEGHRLQEAVHGLEDKLAVATQELQATRAQLQDAVEGRSAAQRHAESTGGQVTQQQMQVDRLALRLSEEQSKTAALRAELAALSMQHVRELEVKAQQLTEVTVALGREERARQSAAAEAGLLRGQLAHSERDKKGLNAAFDDVGLRHPALDVTPKSRPAGHNNGNGGHYGALQQQQRDTARRDYSRPYVPIDGIDDWTASPRDVVGPSRVDEPRRSQPTNRPTNYSQYATNYSQYATGQRVAAPDAARLPYYADGGEVAATPTDYGGAVADGTRRSRGVALQDQHSSKRPSKRETGVPTYERDGGRRWPYSGVPLGRSPPSSDNESTGSTTLEKLTSLLDHQRL